MNTLDKAGKYFAGDNCIMKNVPAKMHSTIIADFNETDGIAIAVKTLNEFEALIATLGQELAAEKSLNEAMSKMQEATITQIEQALTDPENQPSQFGTVPLKTLATTELALKETRAFIQSQADDHCDCSEYDGGTCIYHKVLAIQPSTEMLEAYVASQYEEVGEVQTCMEQGNLVVTNHRVIDGNNFVDKFKHGTKLYVKTEQAIQDKGVEK